MSITRKDLGGRQWSRLSHRRKVMARKQGIVMFKMTWGA